MMRELMTMFWEYYKVMNMVRIIDDFIFRKLIENNFLIVRVCARVCVCVISYRGWEF